MNEYGMLEKVDGRYALEFKRHFPFEAEHVFDYLTKPEYFSAWYPFATGEMDLQVGGKIVFDDGEGTVYEAVITEFNPPWTFYFREVDDLLHMHLDATNNGCLLNFTHMFDDPTYAKYMAAGWHRCLDALDMLVQGNQPEWPENGAELREIYERQFDSQ
ncbi:SRPBCC domain-containing protein [Alkalibacillus salilacus]|uniref:Uncharacterized protein YndB with AHSA1/START domain n=1 Tax=Alkalibacillus salilacus TaxID=284582 RepID=A0ABT9VEQ9_9BACI|nr:SRPBCC domain-containing protein [Alkalibacillus salilacus]MDQ0159462.1 uncharacterized protein YndB with AHSA1/START domain [Alkalibacillus salilacus]